jgi:hypothetical protein
LPNWLPASLFCFPFGATKLKIQYFLRAQFVPIQKDDWIDAKNKISKFGVHTPIIVYRPPPTNPATNLKFTLRNKIGGLFGLGG